MSRPLSDIKRTAILDAATRAIANLGTAAPTSAISRLAGVADGTLFVYFPTKDDLLREVYLDLRSGLRSTVEEGYPAAADVQTRFRHVWDALIHWGTVHPEKRAALRKLNVSERLEEERQRAARAPCGEIETMIEADLASGLLRKQPMAFLVSTMNALADVVLEAAAAEPPALERLRELGWQAFWGAIITR